jgi:hypothetical protein
VNYGKTTKHDRRKLKCFTFETHVRRADETDQAATIDTSLVLSVLKQLSNNHFMFLIFPHPAIHFAKVLQKQLQSVVTTQQQRPLQHIKSSCATKIG